ncbi:hypothetical protein ACFL67_02410 [candidate division KSB1 bacterium]
MKQFINENLLLSKKAFHKLRNPRKLSFSDVIDGLKVLSGFVTMICVSLLAFSGFIPYLIFGESLTGYMLLLHVSVSPVFAVSLTVLIFLRAKEYVCDLTLPGSNAGMKLCFWCMLILTQVLIWTIILSMYPVFGTQGQENLLSLHLLGALFFVIAGVFYLYFLINSHITETKSSSI